MNTRGPNSRSLSKPSFADAPAKPKESPFKRALLYGERHPRMYLEFDYEVVNPQIESLANDACWHEKSDARMRAVTRLIEMRYYKDEKWFYAINGAGKALVTIAINGRYKDARMAAFSEIGSATERLLDDIFFCQLFNLIHISERSRFKDTKDAANALVEKLIEEKVFDEEEAKDYRQDFTKDGRPRIVYECDDLTGPFTINMVDRPGRWY